MIIMIPCLLRDVGAVRSACNNIMQIEQFKQEVSGKLHNLFLFTVNYWGKTWSCASVQ